MGTACGKRAVEQGQDPDEVWSNVYREKEKNHIYKWAATDGELVKLFEKQGEEGVLRFAEENIKPMLFEGGPRLIGLAEYAMWKKQLASNLGMNEAHLGQFEDKFKEHKALWQLNKRGVEGETLVHLLLHNEDTMCHEVARLLVKMYPGLSGDVFLGDEMFGQTALHLSIVNNDHETAQLLLEAGADVNARACGNFFMPDLWLTKRKVGNYQGLAYFGEYPLFFAACLGSRDLYDLLLDHGAKPNLQDTFGNTVLHMCVISNSISMYSYAVRQIGKKWADPLILNNDGYTALTLASVLGRKEIFDQMLELSKVEFWRFSNMACSAYPIAALDSINIDGTTNYDSALITIINGETDEHLDMVGSDVVQRLLDYKWMAFAKWGLYKRMIIMIIHMIFLAIAAGLRPTELDRLFFLKDNSTLPHNIHMGRPETSGNFGPLTEDYVRVVCEVLCIVMTLQYMYQQTREIRAQGIRTYVNNVLTTPARIIYSFANVFLLLCIPCRFAKLYEIEECFLVIAVPGAFTYGLFFARSFQVTGPVVQIFYSMVAGDLALFLIISSIFMFPFSFILFLLGRDVDAKDKLPKGNHHYCKRDEFTVYYSYSTPFESFITLLRANLKGFDYEELDCHNYEYFAKIIMLIYLLVMAVMMMAILIAMMANTFTKIIDRAEKAWRKQTAEIIMNIERSLDTKSLAKHVNGYSITLHEHTRARGLMVTKKMNITKTVARRRALRLWRHVISKIKLAISKMGVEAATEALHGHTVIELEKPPTKKIEIHLGIASIANVVDKAMNMELSKEYVSPPPPPISVDSPRPVTAIAVSAIRTWNRPHTTISRLRTAAGRDQVTHTAPVGSFLPPVEAPNMPPNKREPKFKRPKPPVMS